MARTTVCYFSELQLAGVGRQERDEARTQNLRYANIAQTTDRHMAAILAEIWRPKGDEVSHGGGPNGFLTRMWQARADAFRARAEEL